MLAANAPGPAWLFISLGEDPLHVKIVYAIRLNTY